MVFRGKSGLFINTKKPCHTNGLSRYNRVPVKLINLFLVPSTGIEPARDKSHTDLNGARLPVPPRRHTHYITMITITEINVIG